MKMDPLTNGQPVKTVKTYYKNYYSNVVLFRALRRDYYFRFLRKYSETISVTYVYSHVISRLLQRYRAI